MPGLLERRLIVVTGKGGTGKSTVAIALGLLAARRGLRSIVAEVSDQDRTARVFGRRSDPYSEEEVAPGLWAISIGPDEALKEYLHDKAGRLADVLTASKTFSHFAQATPGMREFVSIGKVWELAQLERKRKNSARYDLVILDAPATGHGMGLLRTPQTFADIARIGPIAGQARNIQANLADPAFTSVIAVARPEEMPVVETLELRDALRDELGIELAQVVVNGAHADRFSGRDRTALNRAGENGEDASPLARAAVASALADGERVRHEQTLMRRLADSARDTPVTLPFLAAEALGPDEIGELADALETQL
jgi:anion-transporting  ArsA/GET3 family ATPase